DGLPVSRPADAEAADRSVEAADLPEADEVLEDPVRAADELRAGLRRGEDRLRLDQCPQEGRAAKARRGRRRREAGHRARHRAAADDLADIGVTEASEQRLR